MHEPSVDPSTARYAFLPKAKDPEAGRKWWAVALVSSLLGTVVLLGFAAAYASDPDAEGGLWWMLPKHKDSTKKAPHQGSWCHKENDYTEKTLKSTLDTSIASLLPTHDLLGQKMFEASSVIKVDEYFYVVCDSSWAVLRLHETLPHLSEMNELIGLPQAGFAEGDSGFEAIFHDSDKQYFYLMRESVFHKKKDGHFAEFTKIKLQEPDGNNKHNDVFLNYTVVETCPSQLKFEGPSKGFEGAVPVRGKDGELYVLGLCEGNHCKEDDHGTDKGHGRIVVMKRSSGEGDAGCVWQTVKTIEIPKHVQFRDYSAITLHHATQAVAISSQEDSQVFVGKLNGAADGLFDPMVAKFEGHGKIYDFPRNQNCDVQYCNIEGLHWLGDGGTGTPQVLAAVSDKMKGHGKQSHHCQEKDQSLHLFTLPVAHDDHEDKNKHDGIGQENQDKGKDKDKDKDKH